jgi:hypothetical protein
MGKSAWDAATSELNSRTSAGSIIISRLFVLLPRLCCGHSFISFFGFEVFFIFPNSLFINDIIAKGVDSELAVYLFADNIVLLAPNHSRMTTLHNNGISNSPLGIGASRLT